MYKLLTPFKRLNDGIPNRTNELK